MTQHPINLLPEFVRIRCQQGVRTGRAIAAVVAAVAIIVIATTHTRFDLDRAEVLLKQAKDQADIALGLDRRAAELTQRLDEVNETIELQRALRYPFDLTRFLATLINDLPASTTIERLDLEAEPRRTARAQAARSDDGPTVRLSVGELNGFAATDDDIAELVAVMQSRGIFESVTWEFSRSRAVRERPAREFRISFRIDLDRAVEVLERRTEGLSAISDRRSAIGDRPRAESHSQPSADSRESAFSMERAHVR
jgi:Tfp pilus assembly protein PilN